MKVKRARAVLAGTGFEGREVVIRNCAKKGSALQLRREPKNVHDKNAIAVWLECRALFGLLKSWRKIGYIQASRAEKLAPKIDSGEMKIARVSVVNLYCPPDLNHPEVTALIEYT